MQVSVTVLLVGLFMVSLMAVVNAAVTIVCGPYTPHLLQTRPCVVLAECRRSARARPSISPVYTTAVDRAISAGALWLTD